MDFGRGARGPRILKILAKKIVFLVSSGKNQILPRLAPLRKIFENPLVPPPGKNPSDAHAHGPCMYASRKLARMTVKKNVIAVSSPR